MTQDQAVARQAAHENLVRELAEALELLLITAECVKRQADNSGKTPYTDWKSATRDLERVCGISRAALAKARGEQQ